MIRVGHGFSDHVSKEKGKSGKGYSPKNFSYNFLDKLPLVILVIVAVALLLRLFTLQIVRGSYYARLSDENRIRTEIEQSPRGIIFDRNGNALVRNTPAFSVLEGEEVVWISNENATRRIADGEEINTKSQREYLYKGVFAHVLGYIGQIGKEELLLPEFSNYGISDFIGRVGIEEKNENILHGTNGKKLYEVNARGEKIRLLGTEESLPGDSIITTLDLEIQKTVHRSFKEVEKGAAVVSDPRSGEILALYSKPTFDPNLFTRSTSSGQDDNVYKVEGDYKNKESVLLDGKGQPLLNRAISGVYPPGSVFKLITSVAALDSGAIDKNTEIEDTGTRTIGGISFGNWYFLQYGKKDGFLDLVGAIRRSNDIFFYVTAEKTGEDALSDWARKFGLGKPLGIDIPGEAGGTVPDPTWKRKIIGDNWYLGDTYNYGIGQGYLLVTPLQTNTWTNVFANGGNLYRPYLTQGNAKILGKGIVDKDDLDLIRLGMKQACEDGGTGFPLFNFKVKNPNLIPNELDYVKDASAGASTVVIPTGCKTGTSEAEGVDAKPHAWFTVFAPFYNPEISITILVENGGEGSRVAAPIAKEILTKYFEDK